jgi:hypothetical protein
MDIDAIRIASMDEQQARFTWAVDTWSGNPASRTALRATPFSSLRGMTIPQ